MLISAVIITYNESRNIGRCLASLDGVTDEVVVLDSFSTDDTIAICHAAGARVEQHVFDGHIEQKNRAIGLATHDWVLSLDADEALSEPLRAALLALKQPHLLPLPDREGSTPPPTGEERHFNVQKKEGSTTGGYAMNRRTNYCGQWINHSGWYPDRKVRLFDRRVAHWGGRNPHDRVVVADSHATQRLSGDLLHYSYYSVEEHWERARKYARIAAQAMHDEGRRGSWLQVYLSPVVKFLRNYIAHRGFLDGRAGFTICRIAAVETYWKYRWLLDMCR
jgi:glycosyltransferase involved in cell wall biosynthesis